MAHKLIYRYFFNLFVAIDQMVNTLFGGDPDETVSSRIGRCQRGDYGRTWQIAATPLAWAVNVLFLWEGWDHCIKSIEDDEGVSDLLRELD